MEGPSANEGFTPDSPITPPTREEILGSKVSKYGYRWLKREGNWWGATDANLGLIEVRDEPGFPAHSWGPLKSGGHVRTAYLGEFSVGMLT